MKSLYQNLMAAMVLGGMFLSGGPVRADECAGKQDGTPCSDDGEYCTADYCVSQQCTHIPLQVGTACDDGKECTGPDRCDGAGQCISTNYGQGYPCTEDGDDCTHDHCDGEGTCIHPCRHQDPCTTPTGGNGQCIQAGTACPCHPLGRCCYGGGGCAEMTDVECYEWGGTFGGEDTWCKGDRDGDGLDDACQGCACGDINRSGGPVDLNDFALFATCFGLAEATPPDCPEAIIECSDLDGDGIVGLADFATFANWYGLESTLTAPDCGVVE
jgi:hypothetical protein